MRLGGLMRKLLNNTGDLCSLCLDPVSSFGTVNISCFNSNCFHLFDLCLSVAKCRHKLQILLWMNHQSQSDSEFLSYCFCLSQSVTLSLTMDTRQEHTHHTTHCHSVLIGDINSKPWIPHVNGWITESMPR